LPCGATVADWWCTRQDEDQPELKAAFLQALALPSEAAQRLARDVSQYAAQCALQFENPL
jgi:hypothetical protein